MKVIKCIWLLIFFSLTGAILLSQYSSASMRGSFVQWESLGKPSSKAVKVVALDYVKTESGEIYQYVHEFGCGNSCWVISDNPPSDSEYWLPLDDCGNVPPLDNYVDSKAVCEHWGPGISLTIYAIDNNGFVYSWNHRLGEGDSLFHFLSPYIGAISGFIIGFIVLLVIMFSDLLMWFQKRAQKRVSEDA
jgi:hypothetical protein